MARPTIRSRTAKEQNWTDFGLRLKFETLVSAKDKVTQCVCVTLYVTLCDSVCDSVCVTVCVCVYTDVDECETRAGSACQHCAGTCVNTVSVWHYTWHFVTLCDSVCVCVCVWQSVCVYTDLDECETGAGSACHHGGGTCVNTVGSFRCHCQPGYKPLGHAQPACIGLYRGGNYQIWSGGQSRHNLWLGIMR